MALPIPLIDLAQIVSFYFIIQISAIGNTFNTGGAGGGKI